MGESDEKMTHFVSSIRETAMEYEKAKKEAIDSDNLGEANYLNQQIDHLRNLNVINSLSRYCVIPKYGFPVDVVDLQTYEEGRLVDKYDLSRDLKMAISEYAPDSEVIVDGKKYTSKYISLPKTGTFARNYFCICPKCKKINIALSLEGLKTCSCGKDLTSEGKRYFIEPVNGFKTGLSKESSRLKPKRSYSGDVSYLGGGIKDEFKLELDNILVAESSSNDELLVVNGSDFYMCPKCGYSDMGKNNVIIPHITKKHNNYRQYNCENDQLELLKLGHKFQTDVVRLSIPLLSVSYAESLPRVLSFLYALLEGISNGLGIERNDLDGIIEINTQTNSYDILLYDNVPGGAGHVKRLMRRDAIIVSLESSLKKVTQECCDEDTSCYNCLRNYYNQYHHNKLKTKYAKEVILMILNELTNANKLIVDLS